MDRLAGSLRCEQAVVPLDASEQATGDAACECGAAPSPENEIATDMDERQWTCEEGTRVRRHARA